MSAGASEEKNAAAVVPKASLDVSLARSSQDATTRVGSPNGADCDGGQGPIRWSRPLSDPEDQTKLSELARLVRSQIEVFVATPRDLEDRSSRGGRGGGSVDVGRVGIRCAHCVVRSRGAAPLVSPLSAQETKPLKLARGAVAYPNTIRLVNQAVRNFQRNHFWACQFMPEDVKARYTELKTRETEIKYPKKRSGNESAEHWEESLRRMGLVDTPDRGIRLVTYENHAKNTTGMDTVGLNTGVRERSDASCNNASNLSIQKETRQLVKLLSEPGEQPLSVQPTPGPDLPISDAMHHSLKNQTLRVADLKEVPPCGSDSRSVFLVSIQSGGEVKDPLSISSTPAQMHQLFKQEVPTVSPCHQGLLDKTSYSFELAAPIQAQSGGFDGASAIARTRAQDEKVLSCQNLESFAEGQPNFHELCDTIQLASTENRVSPKVTNCSTSEEFSMNEAALVDRLQLAYGMVQTVESMRQFPPKVFGSGGEQECAAISQTNSYKDLHNLGVGLYELFAGRQPFVSTLHQEENLSKGSLLRKAFDEDVQDENAQVKRKKQPEMLSRDDRKKERKYIPLRELGIPSALCRLVCSLLDTDATSNCCNKADNCYSSIEDVKEDLGLMIADPQRYFLDDASIARGEIPAFNIPRDALYGRDQEMATLREAYDRTVKSAASVAKREVVLLCGYPGSGKTEIVRKVQTELIQSGARFISGKFDAMQQVQPLSALLTGLNEFFGLLTEDTGLLHTVRAAIGEALGGEAKVLTDLIPKLGEFANQSSAQIDSRQATQRLSFLFRKLFQVLCNHAGPIVLYLDDLQWADELSLELLKVLVSDCRIKGLLFIGTYRDNEISSDHLLTSYLECMQRLSNVSVTSVSVGNLSKENVSALLSDALHLLPRTTLGVAEIVVHKTGGNALFVVQFLHSLYCKGLLRFSLSTKRWEWDNEKIRNTELAGNVVELMKEMLLRLPPGVQSALTTAAVFGAKCHESIFTILDRGDVLPVGQGGITKNLDIATAEGFLVREGQTYAFHHDQIQLAAYLSIPDSHRERYHLQVGRVVWNLASAEELDDFLFVVVDQLNRGSCLISDHNEKIKLAKLCLLAGKKAIGMSVFLPASVYLKAGIELLVADDWSNHRERELCLDLYSSCAEIEFCLGDFDNMHSHLEEVFKKASNFRETLRVCSTLVKSLGVRHKTKDALHTATEVLKELGVRFPTSATNDLVGQEISSTREMLSSVDMDSLHNMVTMKDVDKKEAMKILAISAAFAFIGAKDYFALMSCRMVQLSLMHGVCKESAFGFGLFAMILSATRHSTVCRSSVKASLSIIERFQAKECIPQVYAAAYGFANVLLQPAQSCLPCLKHAIDVGLSVGDAENSCLCAHLHACISLQSGEPLGPLVKEMMSHSKSMMEHNPLINTLTKPIRQTALNLLGRSPVPFKLIGEEMDEESLRMNDEIWASMRLSVLAFRIWLKYLFGEYSLAGETVETSQDLGESAVTRPPMFTTNVFYSGLTAMALARMQQQKHKWIDTISKTMKCMNELAATCSWNFQHKLELMNAEYAYLTGDLLSAAEKYDLAAELAAAHKFSNDEALVLERAGIFYLESGEPITASEYFERACRCYTKWGACSKVAHIQERYLQQP